MSQSNSATEFAQLVQITSCMLDALMKTESPVTKRYRYLESARFLLTMAFMTDSIDVFKQGKENG